MEAEDLMTDPIEFAGVISMEDFVRAQRLHYRSTFVWGVRITLAAIVAAIAGVLAVGGPWLGAAVFVATILLLVALVPWTNRWAWRRMYRRQPGLHERLEGVLGEDGIRYRGTLEGFVPWRLFVRARMDHRTILVYQAPNLFNLLQRSLFQSDEDWRRAQELVREKVTPGRGGGTGT